ncbi:MAG TPA: serine/threonine-protein kinase [Solirubrobacterales bacterium]|nr:serine/threonine-protein kinase [Solirubrobacterales bacterium]
MEASQRWAALAPGAVFARYRIERRLGRGGMGIVYEATEPGLERRVALKLIAPEAAADDVFRRRFEHESRIAASVEHPNVVPIYAAGEGDGIPWIAMRLVSGSDLGRRVLAEDRLGVEEAVRIVAQVAAGLDALHAAGLVHRDVKPANVLLSGRPGAEHAYLTDFGVARNVAGTSGLTKTGRFVGTLDYVAPEQIRGGEIDARVDVYALGCMLFKLLTGEVPFPREGEAAKLYAHLNDEPPSPSLFAAQVPAALDRVVARAMAKHPGNRYPSAGDMGRAAAAALSGAPPAEPERTVATGAAAVPTREVPRGETPTSTAPAPGPRPRMPLIAGLGAAGIAAVAAIVVVAGSGDGSGDRSADGSARPTAKGSVDAGNARPEPLSRDELVRRSDDICLDSQNQFVHVSQRFPTGEEEATVPFARRLVQISTEQLNRLESLTPPPGIASEFDRYVELRRAVNRYDKNALAAAAQDDVEEFRRWREANFAEGPERFDLGRRIGFEICSAVRNPQG